MTTTTTSGREPTPPPLLYFEGGPLHGRTRAKLPVTGRWAPYAHSSGATMDARLGDRIMARRSFAGTSCDAEGIYVRDTEVHAASEGSRPGRKLGVRYTWVPIP